MYPVDPVAFNIPTYFDVIKNPMDISTVQNKVDKGIYYMQKEFDDDVRLIWANAMLFNQEGEEIHLMAKRLNDQFNTLCQTPTVELMIRKKAVPKKTFVQTKKTKTEKPLTFEEKKNLSMNIQKLAVEDLVQVMQIVKQGKNVQQ